jgi:plasmid maintenance system antidote protein VapI
MDLRLSEALGTTPGHWLTMQTQRDLWEASQKAKQRPKVKRIKLALAQANCNPAG